MRPKYTYWQTKNNTKQKRSYTHFAFKTDSTKQQQQQKSWKNTDPISRPPPHPPKKKKRERERERERERQRQRQRQKDGDRHEIVIISAVTWRRLEVTTAFGGRFVREYDRLQWSELLRGTAERGEAVAYRHKLQTWINTISRTRKLTLRRCREAESRCGPTSLHWRCGVARYFVLGKITVETVVRTFMLCASREVTPNTVVTQHRLMCVFHRLCG